MSMTDTPHPALPGEAIARLELATADAVAPKQVLNLGDWLLCFDPSTIVRAKSAAPLRHHGLDPSAVPTIAQRYRDHGMAPLFRVTDAPTLARIHAALRRLDLAPTQPTLVQVARIQDVLALPSDHTARLSPSPSPAWGDVYTAAGFDPVDGAFRRAALSRSPFVVYAHVHAHGTPLAAGTASVSRGWASIHGMRTVTQARGQGLARAILVALARHAHTQGMTHLFLQVEEGNTAAQSLYRRAGFHTAWRYHTWRSTSATGL